MCKHGTKWDVFDGCSVLHHSKTPISLSCMSLGVPVPSFLVGNCNCSRSACEGSVSWEEKVAAAAALLDEKSLPLVWRFRADQRYSHSYRTHIKILFWPLLIFVWYSQFFWGLAMLPLPKSRTTLPTRPVSPWSQGTGMKLGQRDAWSKERRGSSRVKTKKDPHGRVLSHTFLPRKTPPLHGSWRSTRIRSNVLRSLTIRRDIQLQISLWGKPVTRLQ